MLLPFTLQSVTKPCYLIHLQIMTHVFVPDLGGNKVRQPGFVTSSPDINSRHFQWQFKFQQRKLLCLPFSSVQVLLFAHQMNVLVSHNLPLGCVFFFTYTSSNSVAVTSDCLWWHIFIVVFVFHPHESVEQVNRNRTYNPHARALPKDKLYFKYIQKKNKYKTFKLHS